MKWVIMLLQLFQLVHGRCLPKAKYILGRRILNEVDNVCIPEEYIFEYRVSKNQLFI
jgi:hypothetical protein